jgi:hypothetical protein
MLPIRPTSVAVAACVAAMLLIATSVQAACPANATHPATFPDGLEVHPYSRTNLVGSQEFCLFLENTSASTIPAVKVLHQMEEPGTGVPGPWTLLSSSSINISGGVSVTCSSVGNVGITEPTFASGALAAGAITDICCFVLQANGAGCSSVPDAGDLGRHTAASGDVVLTPLSAYDPVGGTTCGLVGWELFVVFPIIRAAHRRRSS